MILYSGRKGESHMPVETFATEIKNLDLPKPSLIRVQRTKKNRAISLVFGK